MYSISKLILVSPVLIVLLRHSESCCCTIRHADWWDKWMSCGCNFFSCNCDFAGDDLCYYRKPLKPESECTSDTGKFPVERCSTLTLRNKRSISSASFTCSMITSISLNSEQNYHLYMKQFQTENSQANITHPAEIFATLDKNKDGYVTLKEMEHTMDYLMSKCFDL